MTEQKREAWLLRAIPVFIAAATTSIYLQGSDRPYEHDEATSVAFNIADRPWQDALGGEVIYSNQPLSSVLGQIVWRLGGTTESWQRLIPALAAGLVVGLIYWSTTRRWGAAAGVSAVLVLALNPLFIAAGRSVRGYALMMLGVIVSTLLLQHILAIERGPKRLSPLLPIVYSLTIGAAIGSHAYAGMVLLAHAAYLASLEIEFRPWIPRLGFGLVVGGTIYSMLLRSLAAGRGRLFRPEFPVELVRDFGGGTLWIGLPMLFAFTVFTGRQLRERAFVAPTLVLGSLCLFLWLGLAPFDLYTRFFLSLLPLFAVGVAVSTTQRLGWLGAGALAAAMIASVAANPPDDGSNNHSRELAELFESVASDGGEPCALGFTGYPILPYAADTNLVLDIAALEQCTVAVTYRGWGDSMFPLSGLTKVEALSPRSQYLVAWRDPGLDDQIKALQNEVLAKES